MWQLWATVKNLSEKLLTMELWNGLETKGEWLRSLQHRMAKSPPSQQTLKSGTMQHYKQHGTNVFTTEREIRINKTTSDGKSAMDWHGLR